MKHPLIQVRKTIIIFLLTWSAALNGYSQYWLSEEQADSIINLMPDNLPRYFDSHGHTTNMGYYTTIPRANLVGKNGFSQNEIKYYNWQVDTREPNYKGNTAKNYRQTDYYVLNRSYPGIICTSITPVEKRFTKGIRKKLISSFVTGYSVKRLVATSKTSSFDEFMGEYRFMLAQDTIADLYKSRVIKPVRNREELIQNFKAGNTSLLLSLEGAHILDGSGVSFYEIYHHGLYSKAAQKDILDHIDSLKNLEYPPSFITLGHFAWNGVVGFVKTLDENKSLIRKALLKFSESEKFRIWLFKKYSDGIIEYTYANPPNSIDCNYKRDTIKNKESDTVIRTTLGYDVIKRLLDTTGHKVPILIDVKHMDIKARLQYYAYLAKNNPHIPIIFSHGAVSGKSVALTEFTGLYPFFDMYEEVNNPHNFSALFEDCLKSKGLEYKSDSLNWFYPWSLNLANEEIPIIYNSDGIIGITLDERLLGNGRPNYDADTPSVQKFLDSKLIFNQGKREEFIQMQPFFRNIFYVAEHSGRTDSSAWRHIVIGSDFDGFIKPVPYCRTAAEIPRLWSMLYEFIEDADEYIYKDNKHTRLYGLSPKQIADNIIFKNGERFAFKYFPSGK